MCVCNVYRWCTLLGRCSRTNFFPFIFLCISTHKCICFKISNINFSSDFQANTRSLQITYKKKTFSTCNHMSVDCNSSSSSMKIGKIGYIHINMRFVNTAFHWNMILIFIWHFQFIFDSELYANCLICTLFNFMTVIFDLLTNAHIWYLYVI